MSTSIVEEEAIEALENCAELDNEAAHCEADSILLELLEKEGYTAVVATYKELRDEVDFWYA